MIFNIFSAIIVFILFLVFIIDLIPKFNNWLSRIHIGRHQDFFVWKISITSKAVSWLCNIPKIKVTDNTRLIVLDMLKGNYSKSTIQYWQEAALLLGLNETLMFDQDEKVQLAINKFLQKKFNSQGDWNVKPREIDSAILSYAVMNLEGFDKDKYRKAFDYTWQLIKEHIGIDGTVQYRKSMKDYRYVDTIGFICPFLIKYGVEYNKLDCVELAVKQIIEYEKFGMLSGYYIPCHTYEVNKKIPMGLYGWGRGLGWLAIGLIDSWNELPNNHIYKLKLEEIIKKYAKAVTEFQLEDGSWTWTVTRKETRTDSSTTATLAWFLLNAATIKEISEVCLESSERAIKFLMKVTRRNGAVDFSQGDTKDIGVYSQDFGLLPFTQGFCIRVLSLYKSNRTLELDQYSKKQSIV
ncbi:glycoside hydrolase family 88 protein [Bacillus sp. 1P10SD]|uniref:glycoside hydrolase family 88 protein n=1 Tax=Bacillus sp. 1P10SD TaxID=3132265 RepID=UPI0039A4E055